VLIPLYLAQIFLYLSLTFFTSHSLPFRIFLHFSQISLEFLRISLHLYRPSLYSLDLPQISLYLPQISLYLPRISQYLPWISLFLHINSLFASPRISPGSLRRSSGPSCISHRFPPISQGPPYFLLYLFVSRLDLPVSSINLIHLPSISYPGSLCIISVYYSRIPPGSPCILNRSP
jgi:hypothetical protein